MYVHPGTANQANRKLWSLKKMTYPEGVKEFYPQVFLLGFHSLLYEAEEAKNRGKRYTHPDIHNNGVNGSHTYTVTLLQIYRQSIYLEIGFWGVKSSSGVSGWVVTTPKTTQNQVDSRTKTPNTPQLGHFLKIVTHTHMHSDFYGNAICFGRVPIWNMCTCSMYLYGQQA